MKIRRALPEALQRVWPQSVARTSQIEWTVSWGEGRDEGLVERYITRTAGDAVWESNLGDDNGHHRMSFGLRPSSDATREELEALAIPAEQEAGTRNSLLTGERVWHVDFAEHALSGDVEPRSRVGTISPITSILPLDFSAIGLAPGAEVSGNLFGVNAVDLRGFEDAEFRSYRSGSFEVVVAEYNDRRFEWYLDPKQGGLPIQASLYRGDQLAGRSETEYEEIDGRLFPIKVAFYSGDSDRASRVIDVDRATFDQPWHMQSIGPNDIGILFGTQLWSSVPGSPHIWDGAELLTIDEYSGLVELYGVRPDPLVSGMIGATIGMTGDEYNEFLDHRMAWRRDAYFEKHGERPWLDAPVGRVPGVKDEWDVYVEAFIKEHELVPAAVKRAKDILDRSKKLRDRHQRKNAAAIRDAQREGDEEKVAYYEGITKRIFDEVLVRSLKKLVPKPEKKEQADNVATTAVDTAAGE